MIRNVTALKVVKHQTKTVLFSTFSFLIYQCLSDNVRSNESSDFMVMWCHFSHILDLWAIFIKRKIHLTQVPTRSTFLLSQKQMQHAWKYVQGLLSQVSSTGCHNVLFSKKREGNQEDWIQEQKVLSFYIIFSNSVVCTNRRSVSSTHAERYPKLMKKKCLNISMCNNLK